MKTVGSEEESHLPTPKTKSSVSMITTPVEMSSPLSPIKAQELKYKINQRKKPSKRKLNTFSSTVSSKNSRNIVVNYKKMYSDLMENNPSNESDGFGKIVTVTEHHRILFNERLQKYNILRTEFFAPSTLNDSLCQS